MILVMDEGHITFQGPPHHILPQVEEQLAGRDKDEKEGGVWKQSKVTVELGEERRNDKEGKQVVRKAIDLTVQQCMCVIYVVC